MGEEVRMSEYGVNGESNGGGGGEDDERILEWEMGLPYGEDLMPLSQSLIPPELASAFSISPISCRTLVDVNRASQTTLSSIRGSQTHALLSTNNSNGNGGNNNGIKSFAEVRGDPMAVETEDGDENGSGSETRRTRKQPECTEEEDSAAIMMRTTENSNEDPSSARTLKRPRLVWTPQLHKRFVDVVAHLGIKNAVPKTIMQLMNVEGLTRENVASHLQKYRLYLKRMQGLSNDDPSPSDPLFASTPVPPQCYETAGNSHNNNNNNSSSSNNNGHMGVSIPPQMMSMPVYGMMNQGFHHGHGFEQNMYNMNMNMNMGMNNMMQQRDWTMNKHYQHHVSPSTDK
ncbi:hypothetical protein LWI28_009885 [Acer negundo]|uniref:HTH myb-type domain-containing protein n=1 Tax=Acer negundo TaxID=4023 RepID=A0AAD5JCZ5_ACENE|nr:hypothetical protein LWI28_009885 [Acer negundo]